MNNDESVTLFCHSYYLRFEMVSSRYISSNDSYRFFINNKCYVHSFDFLQKRNKLFIKEWHIIFITLYTYYETISLN